MFQPRKTIAAGLAGALALGGSLAASNAAMAWEPKKPVEFIIMAGTGGGADQIARLLQGLIEKKDLSPRPFIPINKPGGSGAEALRYLQDKAGDEHTVLVTLNSFYTTPIIQPDLGVDVSKFTHPDRPAWRSTRSCCGCIPTAVTSPISTATSPQSRRPARAGRSAAPAAARRTPS